MSTIIHTSPLPDVEIPDQSITDCVFASAADHADEVAITLAPGADAPTLEDLQSHVGEHLATYKQVRAFEVLEAIPKSASGKILRRELRDR